MKLSYSTQNIKIELVNRLHSETTPFERAANASLRRYRPYVDDEPYFDQTNTLHALDGNLDFPELGSEYLHQLLSFARQQNWQGIFGCKARVDKVAKHSLDDEDSVVEHIDAEIAAGIV